MKTQKKHLSAIVLIAAALVAAVSAQGSSIAGKWDISADSPHGKLTLELDLKQDGDAVSGTVLNFRNQRQPVKGDFKKGALTLQTTSGDEIALSATLKPDGTLAGQLSTAQGDLNWIATRAKKPQ
jgi:hypothetical protein